MTDKPELSNIDLAYEAYRTTPSPDTLSGVVDALDSTINYNLNQRNLSSNTLMRNRAKLFAADAVKKYDPTFGASLPTFVNTQLMQLNREARKHSLPVKVSDRKQLEAFALKNAEAEFFDEHDREPDLVELADRTGFSIKKIEKLRDANFAQSSDAVFENNPAQEGPNWLREAYDIVYQDTDHINRKLMEYKIGYGGKKPLGSNLEIAAKLQLHPSQVSRRLFRISKKIEELEQALQEINS